jgi:hypothetical protein
MRITESQIRQIIRQEVKRVIAEGNHSGHDTHSPGDGDLMSDTISHFVEELRVDPLFGPGSDAYDNVPRSVNRVEALRRARKAFEYMGDNIRYDYSMYGGRGKLSEKDSAYDDDTYEPVDENHRPSNRSQMMFPLHALRESKLRLRRPS